MNEGKKYVEVALAAESALFDDLVGVLSGRGFEGFWEDGEVLRCYVPASIWSPSLRAWAQESAAALSGMRGLPAPRFTEQEIPDRNWNEEWERTITPITVTDRIVIAPSWHPVKAEAGRIVLTIDPKMAFGTGYHESTRLSLQLLERLVPAGGTVLDVGTGTGVLAIAAVRLGAASATGVDIDDWAYRNALENVKANGVEGKVSVSLGGIQDIPPVTYDLIVANIQRNVLMDLLPAMMERLAAGGTMILAGLLTADEKPLTATLREAGMKVTEELHEGEWVALAAQGVRR
jgi:ribosomal protein L11 methyltransferase